MLIIIRKASTFYSKISLSDNHKNPVVLSQGDQLIFTVRKNYDDDQSPPLIRKVIRYDEQIEGGYPFVLTPEETNLPAGTYYYDVGLQCQNGEFYHITMAEQFVVNESISRKEST